MTEEQSIGYQEGFQDGWNAATEVQQPPVQEPTERKAPCARHCEAQAFKIEQRQLVRLTVDYMEIIAKQRVVMQQAWEVLGSMDVGTTSRTLGARVALREVLDMPGVAQPRKAVKLTDEEIERLRVDAARYAKLRGWMSSNVKEGWQEVENMGAIASWTGWDAFDSYLDAMHECAVGLMSPPVTMEAKT